MTSPRAAIGFLNSGHHTRNNATKILDALLTNIPSFSVGLLGFAVLTFFLILKKLKLPSFLLLSSVLLLFFSAIVDVVRVYFIFDDNRAHDQSLHRGVIMFLITIREVLIGIATGLRFLFFWAYASEPPLCEQASASFLSMHSGNWLHWGLTGSLLRMSTLGLQSPGPVYFIDSGVEIIASSIFIVKLILNVMIVEERCRRQTLWQYLATMLALFVNMGIAIGKWYNVILCTKVRFSETVFGRLLLATELYLLIVVNMVFSFYIAPEVPSSSPSSKRDSSFRGLRVSFYDVAPYARNDLYPMEPALPLFPPIQRSSSWLDQVRCGGFRKDPPNPENISPDPAQDKRRKGPVPASLDVVSPDTYPLERQITAETTSSFTHQLPLGTPYGITQSSSIPATGTLITSPDSPTLGPDAIGPTRDSEDPSANAASPSIDSLATSQTSGFEALLRQQNELERDIVALQTTMFGPEQGEGRKGPGPDPSSKISERSRARESSGTGIGPKSASNKSDFSLSVFPEPPPMRQVTSDFSTYSRQSVLQPTLVPSTRVSVEQRFPTSTRESDVAVFGRPESAGTRYDVTSFIGDLTAPNPSTSLITTYLTASEPESEAVSVASATIVTVEEKPSIAVPSRPQVIEKGPISRNETFSSSGSITPTPSRNQSAVSVANSTVRSRIPTLTAFNRAPSARLLPGGRVGLPPRPKLDVPAPSQ
ncbi:hypothetical protein BGW80DRAFT_1263354 [Lactifluus volemus]|nr:hypothetical protein BGW80DRAFT_1263354 [Lactifluus volemus]